MTEIKYVQVVDDDYEEEDAIIEDEEGNADNKQIAAVALSKSWSVSSAHVPTYTGGRIAHCHTRGIPHGTSDLTPFLVLPVNGDLALVDARKGTKIRTLRQDSVASGDNNDGEELDGDAVTAYALSSDDEMIITCSQNQLLRQYSLKIPAEVKMWGKSGHTLPVTSMAFHPSNVLDATA